MNRLAPLDYLRGLSAFGIMFFHYTMWTMGDYTASDFLGRAGVYGVGIFYILSGITLYHVYYDCIGNPSKTGLTDYAIKRIARIFPLLWLMTLATLWLKQEYYPTATIILNFTGLFSICHWGDTICYGAWSIGNELVFYLFFPLFVFLTKRSKPLMVVFFLLLAIIFLWFTFIGLSSAKTFSIFYFYRYINPLNQVFLFMGGYLIGHFTKGMRMPWQATIPLIVFSLLIFTFYPAKGDTIVLVTGSNRLVFTFSCILLCFACYKTEARLPGILHRFFAMLGEVSYSVYLSHPLVTFVLTKFLRKHFPEIALPVVIASCILCTILVSWLIYGFYEKPFMRSGKLIAKKLTVKTA